MKRFEKGEYNLANLKRKVEPLDTHSYRMKHMPTSILLAIKDKV